MAVLGEFTPYKVSYDLSVCANLNVQIMGKRPTSKLHPERLERDFTNETLPILRLYYTEISRTRKEDLSTHLAIQDLRFVKFPQFF